MRFTFGERDPNDFHYRTAEREGTVRFRNRANDEDSNESDELIEIDDTA